MAQSDELASAVVAWYLVHRRDLPWRAPDRTPWGVLVSEIMLAQTPVARVVPAWENWMGRWPTPAALADATQADVLRAWDRLGYPRRALSLHAAAEQICRQHGGAVPEDPDALRALPGVGEYTTAAVRAFAFGRRCAVLDTNVRRVLARLVTGQERPGPSLTVAERRLAESLLPVDEGQAATWSVAVMELGALVCTARSPDCQRCPVRDACVWVRAGRPAYQGPARRAQKFAGTDRQVRGRLMAVLRAATAPVPREQLDLVWPESVQRDRALSSLLADGLVDQVGSDRFSLPGAGAPQVEPTAGASTAGASSAGAPAH